MSLTRNRLSSLLSYDPNTGIWLWIARSSKAGIGGGSIPGAAAGCLSSRGYRFIGVDRHLYRAARLAFLYMTGNFPKHTVDHINGNPSDDRWCNLREATSAQNQWNTKTSSRNKSGFRGVSRVVEDNGLIRWASSIMINGNRVYLGYFRSPEEANVAYTRAADKMHGEFRRI